MDKQVKIRAEIQVFGDVQGVYFRRSAQREAHKLALNGFAKNMPDGTVYIELEGSKEKIEQFIAWAKTGPEPANVAGVDYEYTSELKNFSSFTSDLD